MEIEPWEEVVVEVPDEYQGVVMEKMAGRKARMEAIRCHEHGVRAEQGRYLILVGLELVEGMPDRSRPRRRVLQLDHRER